MRLIDADELIEHVWRDKLDSRELIAEMIEKSPTIKEIPINIPIDVFEKLISQESKTGHWKPIHVTSIGQSVFSCSECEKIISVHIDIGECLYNYCPNCGIRMRGTENDT